MAPSIEETMSLHLPTVAGGTPGTHTALPLSTAHGIANRGDTISSFDQKRIYRSSSDGTCLDVLHSTAATIQQPAAITPPPHSAMRCYSCINCVLCNCNCNCCTNGAVAATGSYHPTAYTSTPVYQYPETHTLAAGTQYLPPHFPAGGNSAHHPQTPIHQYSPVQNGPTLHSPVYPQYSQAHSPLLTAPPPTINDTIQTIHDMPTGADYKLDTTQFDIETDGNSTHHYHTNNATNTSLSPPYPHTNTTTVELAITTTQMLADNLVKQIQLVDKHLGHSSPSLHDQLNKAYLLAHQANTTLIQATYKTKRSSLLSCTPKQPKEEEEEIKPSPRQPPKNLQIFKENSPSPSPRLSRSNCIRIHSNNNTNQRGRPFLLSQQSTSSEDLILHHEINTTLNHTTMESPHSLLESSNEMESSIEGIIYLCVLLHVYSETCL